MKFFFTNVELNFKFQEGDYILNKKVSPKKERQKIYLNEVYFSNEPFIESFLRNLPEKNKNIISLIPENQFLKLPQFPKNLSRETTLETILKDENLQKRGLINIAVLNNLGKPDFETEKNIIDILYNFFRTKFKYVNINLFNGISLRLLDDISEMPIISLFQEPETLERLLRNDIYIDFDELRKLGVTDEPLIKQFEEKFYSEEPIIEDTEQPLVSVVIPTYNKEKYIGEAVQSALNQTYKNLEVIVVDDGSTDNTKQVVEELIKKDGRVKYFYQENQGSAAARNKGLQEASGEFVAFLDSDDTYFPYAIEKMIYLFKTQPENVKLVYGNFVDVTEGKSEKIYREISEPRPKPLLFQQFLIGNPLLPTISMLKKDVFDDIGFFDTEFSIAQDYDLWVRLILKYDVAKLNLPVSIYRRHEKQITENQGVLRYEVDKVALKLFYSLKPEELIGEKKDKKEIATKLENLAQKMLQRSATPFDTVLEILKEAQKYSYSKERQEVINKLIKEIPDLIKEKFGSDLRINQNDKAEIRRVVRLKQKAAR